MIDNNDITLIDWRSVNTDEYEISKSFNKLNINIVEKSCASKPNKTRTTLRPLNDSDVVDRVIESYQNHLGMLKTKNKFGSDLNRFDSQKIKAPELKNLFKK